MTGFIILYYLCSGAGAFMILGGIVLLYKQKIFIDRETQQITEVETPIGKFRTNVPALLLFALGFVPLIYPIWQLSQRKPMAMLSGEIELPEQNPPHVTIWAVAGDWTTASSGKFAIEVPAKPAEQYHVLFTYCDGQKVSQEDTVTKTDGDTVSYKIEKPVNGKSFVCPQRLAATQ